MRSLARTILLLIFSLVGTTLSAKIPDLPNVTVYSAYQDEFKILWIATQDGLLRYDGVNTEVFRPEEGNPASIYNNNIKAVCGDREGNVFVISKFALCRYDQRKETFTTLRRTGIQAICYGGGTLWAASADSIFNVSGNALVPAYDFDGEPGSISSIMYSSDGLLYVGTRNGLYSIDNQGKRAELSSTIDVQGLYEDSKKNIWVCTRRSGLLVLRPDGSRMGLRSDGTALGLSSDYVRTVCEDAYGDYWIGTLNGVDVFNTDSQTVRKSGIPGTDRASVHNIIRDSQNSLWICTRGGLFLYNRGSEIYTHHDELFSRLGTNIISSFAEKDGYYYFSSVETGIVRYSPASGKASVFPGRDALPSTYIESMLLDNEEDALWAGTRFGGLCKINLKNGKTRVILPRNSIYRMGAYKNLLVLSSREGALILDKRSGKIEDLSQSPRIKGHFNTDLSVDDDGNCWVSVSEGLLRHNLDSGEEKEYFFVDKGVLGTNRIQTSFQDSKGRRWFGTTGSGLLLYDSGNDSFKAYTSRNSLLSNDYIWSIAESKLGYILLTTNDGFTRFDADKEVFYNYSSGSGFPEMSFSPCGLFVSSSGEVFVSGYRDLISFREQQIPVFKSPDKLFFSSMETGNARVRAGDASRILSESLLYQDHITLKGSNTVISVLTSAPDYLKDNWMEYRLDGFSDEWVKCKVGERIVYTNLKPRNYLLTIRCVDPRTGFVSASDSLTINVKAEWYWSTVARLFYLLVLALAVIAIIRYYAERVKYKANQSKLQFYTFVSHELRTPVTLIQGQLESLLAKKDIPPFIHDRLTGIKGNIGKLNDILGELKDYRKQRFGSGHLHTVTCNLVPQLENAVKQFMDYARNHGVTLSFRNAAEDELMITCDKDQLDKVFSNLISNAIKNTGRGGEVNVTLTKEGDKIAVQVRDTGVGIPEKYLQDIYQPFFQVPGSPAEANGTGLGLTIVKGIVDAHGGSIRCFSKERIGTVFTVVLPADSPTLAATPENSVSPDLIIDSGEQLPVATGKNGSDIRPSILIVEDNVELLAQLEELFSPIYSVTTASDGVDALEKLKTATPDIILSDLMMPRMDGNELCNKVKKNYYTSHIPVVILTAKDTEESMLESLRSKADDYIVKPYNARLLVSRCNNLVNTRHGLQAKYSKSDSNPAEVLAISESDREFIEKATAVVKANLSESSFDVAKFASEMAMGRTGLFQKLGRITGLSPNHFIMDLRLKHARELLSADSNYSVSEVSYMAGFSSPSYFIKSFRNAFGITPSAFRNTLKA